MRTGAQNRSKCFNCLFRELMGDCREDEGDDKASEDKANRKEVRERRRND